MATTPVAVLQKQFADYTTSLFNQGILNDQFIHVQVLQDETNPQFLSEIVNLFLTEAQKHLNELANNLEQQNVDFEMIQKSLHYLKGSSSSVGAEEVHNACVEFINCCNEKNVEGCITCWEQARNAYVLVKNKLETLLQIEQQIVAAGGSIPMPSAEVNNKATSSQGSKQRDW